ncbi:MAG: HD domain-containing protein [Candidatus Dojkabacteria bacterium]
MDFISEAKNISSKYNLNKYIDILLNYWESNPTSLGHGFSHVLKVAVYSYQLGQRNNYEKPEDLFIGGLFHDIYRPVEDKGGEEDQTKGAEITEKLFLENNIDPDLTSKIKGAILSHDNWIGTDNVPQFDLILSTGDKASHDTLLTDSYVWASIKYSKEKGQSPVFKNHLDTLSLFMKYQQRAWSLFKKHQIEGTELAIEAYIKINEKTFKEWRNDTKGDHFEDYINNNAETFRKVETEYLKAFDRNENSIKKIMTNCY